MDLAGRNGEGSLVAFVVSLNLHRRHLSSSQKAACSLDALPFFEAEAKKKQRLAGEQHGRGQEKVVQFFEQPIKRMEQKAIQPNQ